MSMPESEKRAREKWGKGWSFLSTDMQKMAINQEKYFLIMAEFRSARCKNNPLIKEIIEAIES